MTSIKYDHLQVMGTIPGSTLCANSAFFFIFGAFYVKFHIPWNLCGSTTDGSFTMVVSNSFLSPLGINSIAANLD